MTARISQPVVARPRPAGYRAVTVLWVLLLAEAALGLFIAIYLSDVAGDYANALGEGTGREVSTRFAAGGAFLFAIAAFIAANGARRHRPWAWTLGAVLQLILAIAAGIALFSAEGDGAPIGYLVAFALAAATLLLLSTGSVRRALGQA